MGIWDNYTQTNENGEYPDRIKFAQTGDTLAGTITRIDEIDSDYGTSPVLDIAAVKAIGTLAGDTGERINTTTGTYSVILSQKQLRRKVAAAAPRVGDSIAMVLTGSEPLKGGKTLKLFDVQHKPATQDADEAPFTEQPTAANLI